MLDTIATRPQFLHHGRYAGVRCGAVGRMVKVKGAEGLEYLFAHLVIRFLYARRSNRLINGTAHEAAHAVAQKAAHRVEG
ncbi:MAG: hypothetical protein ACOCM7_05255, partial [Bacteroidales bacterium]